MSKTLQDHRTELNKTNKQKGQESPTVSSCGQTTVILCSTITIAQSLSITRPKKQSSVCDGTSPATVHSLRRRQAVPRTCRSHCVLVLRILCLSVNANQAYSQQAYSRYCLTYVLYIILKSSSLISLPSTKLGVLTRLYCTQNAKCCTGILLG